MTPPPFLERLDNLPEDSRQVAIRDYPEQLAELGQLRELQMLLTSFGFLERKFRGFGLDAVIEDIERYRMRAPAEDAPALRDLAGALRLSAPALRQDAEQFAPQLLGRLMANRFLLLASLVEDASRASAERGIQPLTAALTQAGVPTAATLEVGEGLKGMLITKDEKRLVTSSKAGEITVWRLPLRADSRVLNIRSPKLTAFCLTPDDRYILAGDESGALTKWELGSGFEAGRVALEGEYIIQVEVTKNDRVLVLMRGGMMKVLDLNTLQTIQSFHVEIVNCFLPFSKTQLLAGSHDGCIEIRDLNTGRYLGLAGWHGAYKTERMTDADLWIRTMAYQPLYEVAGTELVGKMDMRAALDEMPDLTPSQKAQMIEEMQKDPIRDQANALAPDKRGGSFVASGCQNGEIALLDLNAGHVIRRLRGHNNGVTCCDLDMERGLLVSGSYDRSIRVWDTNNGAERSRLENPESHAISVIFAADASQVIAAFDNGRLQCWSLRDLEAMTREESRRESIVGISRAGGRVFAITNSTVAAWDPQQRALLSRRPYPEERGRTNQLTPDGLRAVASKRNKAVIWDVCTGWPLRSITADWPNIAPESAGQPGEFVELALTSDLRRMLSYAHAGVIPALTANYGRLELWDVETGQVIATLDSRAGYVTEVAVSADGRWGASLGQKAESKDYWRTEVRVWDLATGKCVREMEEAGAVCLAFDPESEFLWWRVGRNVRRCGLQDVAPPETFAAIGSSWSEWKIGPGRLAVAVADKYNVEIWDISAPRRIGALTLDARVTAQTLLSGYAAAGDAEGRFHFLGAEPLSRQGLFGDASRMLEAAKAVAKRPGASDLELLDAANLLADSDESALALQALRLLARGAGFGVEFQLELASYFAGIGEERESGALLVRISQNSALPIDVRLAAIANLPSSSVSAALAALAEPFDIAFRAEGTGAVDARPFGALIERLIAEGDANALKSAKEGLPMSARAALAQALARMDAKAGADMLQKFAMEKSGDGIVQAVALDGLRHLIPAQDLVTLASNALRAGVSDGRCRDAIAQIVLRAAQLDAGVFTFGSGGKREWYELGLLDTLAELNNRAMGMAAAGRMEEALELLSQGVRFFPLDARLRCNRAGLLIRMKRYREGIADATAALDMDIEYEKAMNFRAYALLETEEYELALADLNNALKLKPVDVANLLNRAHCLRALGRLEEAEKDAQYAEGLRKSYEEDWASPFEKTTRPDRGDSVKSPAVTEEAVSAAIDLLREFDLLGGQIAELKEFASMPDLPEPARKDADEASTRLRAFHEAPLSSVPDLLSAENKLRTACAALAGEGQEERQARETLRAMVVDAAAPFRTRQEAAYALAQVLEPSEVEALTREITDLSVEESPSGGIAVVLLLIKSLGRRGERGRLEAIARDSKNQGWIREIAAETIGAFFDPQSAIHLLEALRQDAPREGALAETIEKAKLYFAVKQDGMQRDLAPDPIVFEAYEAFISALSVEEVDRLAERYPFITDPEFIEQMEQHLGYHAATSDRDILQKKIARLKELPPDPKQTIFRAFARAGSPDEMREVALQYSVLTTSDFQRMIEKIILDSVPEPNRPAYMKRLEWLRAIPADKYQSAMEAFMRADNSAALQKVVGEFPFLRTKRFREMLKRTVFVGSPDIPLDVRLQWLDAIGGDPGDELYDAALQDLVEGHPQAALEKADRIAALDPERRHNLLRGRALLYLGEEERAIEALTQAIESNPSAIAHEGRGKAYMHLGRAANAISDFNEALRLEPDYLEALIGRGLAYSKMGNLPAAIQDLSRAQEKAPDNELVVFALATERAMTGDAQGASETLDSIRDWSATYREQVRALRGTLSGMAQANPAQEAFNAFSQARNEEEIFAAVRNHPLLSHPGFLAELNEFINRQKDAEVRSALRLRFEILLGMVDNPAQRAFDALMAAEDLTDMKRVVQEHTILQDQSFIASLEQMMKTVGEQDTSERIRRQLELLRKASPG